MLDTKQILKDFKKSFKYSGSASVDDQGRISCTGYVMLKPGYVHAQQLPVSFHKVLGNFDCSYGNLVTLQGSPSYVGGSFYGSMNRLESLQGAPAHVSGLFDCCGNQVVDLTGAPEFVAGTFNLPYMPGQNLLRLCAYDHVKWCLSSKEVPEQVEHIMIKYAGTGKPGAIKAAVELIKAGYKEHARW